jgi:hypothetical protein
VAWSIAVSGASHFIAVTAKRLFLLPETAGLRRWIAGAFALVALIAVPTIAPTAAHSAVRMSAREADVAHPHVYLMRGLLNIFSLGMDQIAAQIQRYGIDASVYNHSFEEAVVGDIVRKYRSGDHGPYILVGHSLGADAVMIMAQQLNSSGVPVALVVPFDGTGSYAASQNVSCVLNMTQRTYAYMRPGSGFHGRLQNVDVSADTSIDHFTIDKTPRLQAVALNAILQAARSESCRPGVTGPAVARPKEAPAPKESAKDASKLLSGKDEIPGKSASPSLRAGVEG